MEIFHFTDSRLTDKQWQSHYSLLETLHKLYNSPMARIGWEDTKIRMLSLMESDPDYYRFVPYFGEHSSKSVYDVGWECAVLQKLFEEGVFLSDLSGVQVFDMHYVVEVVVSDDVRYRVGCYVPAFYEFDVLEVLVLFSLFLNYLLCQVYPR